MDGFESEQDRAARRRATKANAIRQKSERKTRVDPTTSTHDYTEEELEFMKAIEEYKKESHRQFPTYSEILGVLKDLGYQKIGISA